MGQQKAAGLAVAAAFAIAAEGAGVDKAQVDEVVVVTPSLDRARRTASYEELAAAWRLDAGTACFT